MVSCMKAKKNDLCPICKECNLIRTHSLHLVEYRNVKKELPLYYHYCNHCGSELGFHTDINDNKAEVVNFKASVNETLDLVRGMSQDILWIDELS